MSQVKNRFHIFLTNYECFLTYYYILLQRLMTLYHLHVSFLLHFFYPLKTLQNLEKAEQKWVNPLNPNPTKWSNALDLSAKSDELFECVFDHFVGWRLKG